MCQYLMVGPRCDTYADGGSIGNALGQSLCLLERPASYATLNYVPMMMRWCRLTNGDLDA